MNDRMAARSSCAAIAAAVSTLELVVLCVLLAQVSCAPSPGSAPFVPGVPCSFGSTSQLHAEPIVIVLDEPVTAAHAPVPANDAERLVFGHLYDTLTRIDCDGTVAPSLGTPTEWDPDFRIWTITLGDARFSDGSHVEPRHVAESWKHASGRSGAERIPWCWIDPNAIQLDGPNRLRIFLREPTRDLPRILAHPSLAVSSGELSHGFPIGSGSYRLGDPPVARGSAGTTTSHRSLELVGNDEARSPGLSNLLIEIQPEFDARDLDPASPIVACVTSRHVLEYLRENRSNGDLRNPSSPSTSSSPSNPSSASSPSNPIDPSTGFPLVIDPLPWGDRYVLLLTEKFLGAPSQQPLRTDDRAVDPNRPSDRNDPQHDGIAGRTPSFIDTKELEHVVSREARACFDLGWMAAECGSLASPGSDQGIESSRGANAEPGRESNDADRGHESSDGDPDDISRDPFGPSHAELASSIVHLASDPDARSIAERLAARASTHTRTGLPENARPLSTKEQTLERQILTVHALPLDAVRFRRALKRGDALAYVLSIPHESNVVCTAPSWLVGLAPWILDGFDESRRQLHPLGPVVPTAGDVETFLLASNRVVPLVQCRSSLIRPPAVGGISFDGSLSLRFESAGWTEGGTIP